MKAARVLGSSAVAVTVATAIVIAACWHYFHEKSQATRLAEEGRQALSAGNFDQAIARFNAAVSGPLDPRTRAGIYTLRAQARAHEGAADAAAADLTLALKLNPHLRSAYRERARLYLRRNEKEKALADYDLALAQGPAEAEDYLARGTLLLAQGQPRKAAADFTEVVQRAPQNAEAFLLRARAYAALDDVDSAVASYDSVLRIDPKNQEAHAERGELHSRRGDMTRAMADYAELRTSKGEMLAAQAVAQSTPESASSVSTLLLEATLKLQAGHPEEAIQLYNRVLRMDIPLPVASTAMQNRGNAYARLGDDDHAMRDYEQAIRFNPANGGAYVNRGYIYSRRNDFEAAIMDYNEALRFDPKMVDALFNRALAYLGQGDTTAAERDLGEAIRIKPDFAPAYVRRGALLATQGKLEQAMSDLNAGIARDPKMAEGYIIRADLFSRRQEYAKEEADLQTAVRLDSHALAQALNGLAWLRATCPEKAFRNGKKAIEDALRSCELLKWENASTVDTLAAAYAENGEFEKAANFQLYALTLSGMDEASRPGAEKRVALYQNRKPYRDIKPE